MTLGNTEREVKKMKNTLRMYLHDLSMIALYSAVPITTLTVLSLSGLSPVPAWNMKKLVVWIAQ